MIKEETKQTAEEAARGYSNDCRNRQRHCEPYCIVDFISGAEWQSKQSPWISVEDKLPSLNQKVIVYNGKQIYIYIIGQKKTTQKMLIPSCMDCRPIML